MKKYDYKSAKRFIQMHSDVIVKASLGMEEDWFWTGEVIYEDNKFVIDLDQENLEIAGIEGSSWATPVLYIQYKDGREEFKNCYTGSSDEDKPSWFSLGELSAPCQEWIDQVKTPKLN